MDTTSRRRFRHYAPLVLLPCLGLVSGWWLRGQQNSSPTRPAHSLARTSTPSSTDLHTADSATTSENTSALSKNSAASHPSPGKTILTRMLKTDDADLVELIESIGAMTRMNDDEVRDAWAALQRRGPNEGWSSRLAAIYFVTRLDRIGEHVQLTGAWNQVGDEYQRAFDAEAARRDPAAIRAKLASGANVSETQRRVYFSQALRDNPAEAMRLWLDTTTPDARANQAKWFGDALAQGGETRDQLMVLLREKNPDPESFNLVMYNMAGDWIANDPEAAERWAAQPAQADLRNSLLTQAAIARSLANPETAWQRTAALPDNIRGEALSFNAGELANHQPEVGKQLLATLKNPQDRAEAIKSFSSVHAANNIDDWQKWRATLPTVEQDAANESAFTFWARKAPDEAVQWLSGRPAGETKNAMVTSLVKVVAEENTDLAIQIINKISDPKTRREAVTTTLQSVSTTELEKIRAILAAAEPEPANKGS